MLEGMKRLWLGVVGGLLVALQTGCSAGQSEREGPCATYSCDDKVTFTGAISVDHPLELVDATYCIRDSCKLASIDVTGSDFDQCTLGFFEDVCLGQANGMLNIQVTWHYGDDALINQVPHRIELVEHDTGAVLLDETRDATSVIRSQDNCHVCWDAETSL